MGYANSRTISIKLIACALLLLIVQYSLEQSFLQLNILFTVMIIRLTIDKVSYYLLYKSNILIFWILSFSLFSFWFLTFWAFEYGTLAILVALFGYSVRHQNRIKRSSDVERLFLTVAIAYIATQVISHGFSQDQFFLMAVTTILLLLMMYIFKPKTFPKLTQTLPHPLVTILQFGGRKTLEIYVVHLIIFKSVAHFFIS